MVKALRVFVVASALMACAGSVACGLSVAYAQDLAAIGQLPFGEEGVESSATADGELPLKAQSGATAFAILDKSNGSLTLYNRDYDSWAAANWNASTMVKYTGFDTDVYSGESQPPWRANASSILSVTVADEVAPRDCSWLFYGLTKCTSMDVAKLDTSHATSMNSMFRYCPVLTTLDVSHLDTSNVTDMSGMFNSNPKLAALDLRSFNTSNVTNMGGMFNSDKALASVDVSSFDTSNVSNFDHMFMNCAALTSLDLSNFDMRNVYTNYQMLYGCTNMSSIKLGRWFKFVPQWGDITTLPTPPATAPYKGLWAYGDACSGQTYTPYGLATSYNGATMAGTYVWAREPPSSTISFRGNGGTGNMASVTVSDGSEYTVPDSTFARAGYEFAGWNTKADGSGVSYEAGATFTVASNLTLYAQWEQLPIRFSVPTELSFAMLADGTLVGPSDGAARIANEGELAISVTGIQFATANGLTIVASDPGDGQFSLFMTPGEGTGVSLADYSGAQPAIPAAGDWCIPASSSLALNGLGGVAGTVSWPDSAEMEFGEIIWRLAACE